VRRATERPGVGVHGTGPRCIAAYRQYTAAGGDAVGRLNQDLTELDKQVLPIGLTSAAVDVLQILVDALQAFTPAAADQLNYQITYAEARHDLIIRLFGDNRTAQAVPLVPPVTAAYHDYAAATGADLPRVTNDLRDLVGQLLGAGLTAQNAAAQRVLDSVPAALPGWLSTTTRRECLRVLRAGRPLAAGHVLDAETLPDNQAVAAEQELLTAERQAALREAFLELPPCGQRLIALLLEDPPVPYAEISVRLGIPIGSIGPNRRRCLDKMRRHPALAALITG
jgi:DNA-directed RNA polymerase specialized sigma24 family protein